MENETISRRTLLRGAGAGFTATALGGRAGATEDERDDRYVVGIRPGRGRSAVRRAADSIDRELEFGAIGRAIAGRFSPRALEALERNPNVRYVERNDLLFAIGQTTPYGVERIEADVAIDEGETGASVSVAVVDTGIDSTHDDLAANLGEGYATDYAACSDDCVDGSCGEPWDDDNGHGTHVAGTVGAVDNDLGVLGVAPDVTLHAVKVLGCDGAGYMSDVAAGIRWATDRGHDVVNLSLGGGASDVVRDAVRYADRNGVVVVAAAGNDGPCSDCVSYPAAYEEVIAVSATDEEDALAEFSNTGPEIDLAAPGANVRSTYHEDRYATGNGTSMACPHVAGSAAQLLASGIDAGDVRDRLAETADDVGLEATEQGAGRVNVAAALGLYDNGTDDGTDDGSDDGTDGDGETDDGSDDGTDDGGDDGTDDGGDTSPAIESLSIRRRTTGPWSRADVTWTVADDDGDLESVTTELLDGTRAVDGATTAVSGSSASGEHDLRTRGSVDAIRLRVVDRAGNESETVESY